MRSQLSTSAHNFFFTSFFVFSLSRDSMAYGGITYIACHRQTDSIWVHTSFGSNVYILFSVLQSEILRDTWNLTGHNLEQPALVDSALSRELDWMVSRRPASLSHAVEVVWLICVCGGGKVTEKWENSQSDDVCVAY